MSTKMPWRGPQPGPRPTLPPGGRFTPTQGQAQPFVAISPEVST